MPKTGPRFVFSLIAAIAGLLLIRGTVHASPAAPLEVTLTQPDGSRFSALPWGDEWLNGYETLSGYSVIQSPDGWWVYADLLPGGLLGPAVSEEQPFRVGIDSPRGLAAHLRPTAPISPLRNRDAAGTLAPQQGGYLLPPASGEMKILVLLAKFEDIDETYPADAFEQLVFGTTGSLKSYYQEVSYGSLNLAPAQENCGVANDGLTTWTTLAYAHPNPGALTGEDNLLITKDALIANDACIDYASFDANSDGGISADELQIVVVVAGWEASYGDVGTRSIWAHSFYLDFVETPTLDGVTLGSYYQQSYYAQIGEIHGTGLNQHPATLGILAHEFGHLLNWPDLYDIDGSSEGVGRWSIMGSGGWNQTGLYAGDTPAHPDAWLKWYQGWLEPVEVTGNMGDIQIEQAEDHASVYLLHPNPNGIDWIFNYHTGRGEYFLVENRQQVLSDAGLPGCGVLIWHIQENLPFNNYVNSIETTPLISLEQADGLDQLRWKVNRGDAGDPYPGLYGNLAFNHDTTPNSRRQDGGVSGVSLTLDTTACGPSMQADLTFSLSTVILTWIEKPNPFCGGWTTMMSEDFEGGDMESWTVIDHNGAEYGEYYPAIRSCRAKNSTNSAWMVGGGVDGSSLACGSYYPDHAMPWMIYGPFSTIGETAVKVDFSHWTYIEPAIPFHIYDRFCVWASENNQQYIGYCLTGDWGGWSDYSFSLKDNTAGFFNFLDKPQVWLAFSLITDDYIHFTEGVYVDNIRLQRCTSPSSGDCNPTPASIPFRLAEHYSLFDLINPFALPEFKTGPVIIGPVYYSR
jgi:M6 family metalloprotease-like protein